MGIPPSLLLGRGGRAVADDTPNLVIERHDAGFIVALKPPVDGADFDRVWPTHRAAHSYARMIRMLRGWPIVDNSEAADEQV